MPSKADLEAELARLRSKQNEMSQRLERMQAQIIEQTVKATLKTLQKEQDPVKAEVLWRLRRTRRDFVCRKITDLCGQGKDLAELKYLIVDQGRYCSKATFYRYVSNLRLQGLLNLVSVGAKTTAIVR